MRHSSLVKQLRHPSNSLHTSLLSHSLKINKLLPTHTKQLLSGHVNIKYGH